jgi:hypothetical protein
MVENWHVISAMTCRLWGIADHEHPSIKCCGNVFMAAVQVSRHIKVHIFSFKKTGTRPWYRRTEISVFQQIEPCIDLHGASLVIIFQLSFSSCLNL